MLIDVLPWVTTGPSGTVICQFTERRQKEALIQVMKKTFQRESTKFPILKLFW